MPGYDAPRSGVRDTLRVLRRRAPAILCCIVAATAAAFAHAHSQPKQFTATASLLFDNGQEGQQVSGLQPVVTNNQQSQQDTNVRLVQIADIAPATARAVGQGLTAKDVESAVTVTPEGDTTIVNVSAVSPSAVMAAKIANTYSAQFVNQERDTDYQYYSKALAAVQQQIADLSPERRGGPQGLALANRAQSLAVLTELRSGVEVAATASVPAGPSSPKIVRDTLLGLMLGALLGFAIAFLREHLDQRVRDATELEEVYDLPLLGVVPETSALGRSARSTQGAPEALPAGAAYAFQSIRARLRYFNVDRDLRVILVASAAPGDGKTTITRRLGNAAAVMDSRVLLIDSDLRRSTLAKQLNLRPGPGLSDVLAGMTSLSGAIQCAEVLPPLNGEPGPLIDVLVSGAPPPNPEALVESHAMEALLEQARADYDLVLIDSPPLGVVPDAFPLLLKVDGVILVARLGHHRRDVAQRLAQTLARVGAPVLGIVANGGAAGDAQYGYSYDEIDRGRPATPSRGTGSRAPKVPVRAAPDEQ